MVMGNGSKVQLEEMTLRQLRLVASEYEVSRYSRMRKVQLVEAIRSAQAARASSTAAPVAVAVGETAVGETATVVSAPNGGTGLAMADLATVDDGFGDLPGGYGESRIVLMPRDPQWAYVYRDIPGSHKEEMRRLGGVR